MSVYILCDMVLKRKWGTPLLRREVDLGKLVSGVCCSHGNGFNDGRQYLCKDIFDCRKSCANIFFFVGSNCSVNKSRVNEIYYVRCHAI